MAERRNQNKDNEGSWGSLFAGLGAAAAVVAGAAYAISKFSESSESASESQETKSYSYGDKQSNGNNNHYANQCNPNHKPTGPGRPAAYTGAGTKQDLDNHANQLNPNNEQYVKSRGHN